MSSELIAALNQIEKEKGIDKEILFEAIEKSIFAACKRDFGKEENIKVTMDRENGDISVLAEKEVVKTLLTEIHPEFHLKFSFQIVLNMA